jgi:hypothetical protein
MSERGRPVIWITLSNDDWAYILPRIDGEYKIRKMLLENGEAGILLHVPVAPQQPEPQSFRAQMGKAKE